MTKDRRVKLCPNETCDRNIKKHRYKAEEKYCSVCGEELVFVCKDCLRKIKDDGPEHRICRTCENKRDISKFKFNANKIANKAGEEIKEAGKAIADVAETGIDIVKEQTPAVIEKIKKIADDEKVKPVLEKVALKAADITLEKLPNGDVKKLASTAVNAAKATSKTKDK